MPTAVEVPAWTCTGCQTERTKPEKRLPGGWHKLKEEPFCAECWGKRYMLRAITMQVAEPLDCEWKELRVSLQSMWALTTQCSNWMVTQLYARDVKRTNEPKMPPMARVYLYPEARERFPGLPSQSVAALEQSVGKKYRAARYELIWTCARSLPTFRYPVPFAVPNQGWYAEFDGERPVISVRIGDARHRLRLKGGPRFRRQRESFGSIVSGDAVQGELAVYETGKQLMVKLVAWLPRPRDKDADKRTGVLSVRTDKDSLLVALNAKDEKLWTYNADHIVRRFREHKDQLQRWADDQKYEQRPVPSFEGRRDVAVRRYRDASRSTVQQVAASLVAYARRRKFAGVEYDDKVTEFCPQFPWFALRERIAVCCDEAGIEFSHRPSDQAAPETGEPLGEE